jgi:hypothetical protein
MGPPETVIGVYIFGEALNYTLVDSRRLTPAPLHSQGDGLLGVVPPLPYLFFFLVKH